MAINSNMITGSWTANYGLTKHFYTYMKSFRREFIMICCAYPGYVEVPA